LPFPCSIPPYYLIICFSITVFAHASASGIFSGNVYGTYVHGIFDEGTLAETLVSILAERKGVVLDTGQMISYGQFKQMQYDKLADGLRESMDMEAVYAMLREAAI